jgi:prevent-host-death family protein
VEETGEPLIITDRGKPVLKIQPYSKQPLKGLEALRDSVVKYEKPLAPVASWGSHGELKNRKIEIDLEQLSDSGKRELMDFYEFLVTKYGKKAREFPIEKNSPKLRKKKLFFKLVKKNSFILPEDYTFNREELYARKNIS